MNIYKITAAVAALMVHVSVFAAVAPVTPNGPAPDGPGARGGRVAMILKMADTNGDGVVTREEAVAGLDTMFARMDLNGDGKITPEERQAARQKMRDAYFARIDTDKSGQLSKSEFENAKPDPKDGPGKQDDMRPPRPDRMGKGGDADKDGVMTRAEFMARPLAMFDRMDTNHDGKLTAEEMRAARPGPGMRHKGMKGPMHGPMGGDMPPPPPPADAPDQQ